MLQEVLEPFVHDKVPYVSAVESGCGFVVNLTRCSQDLGEDVVVRQVVVEAESLDVLIARRSRLDLGKLGRGHLHPDFGDEQPFVYLEAYLGRKGEETE